MPTPSNAFASYCCELLSTAGLCVAKRMFGGYGISTDGLTIALVSDLGHGEKLWLKASPETRAPFEAAGCERFGYTAKGESRSLGYYTAPDAAMESVEEMAPWARMALEAALAARSAKPKPKPKPKSKITAAGKKKTAVKATAKRLSRK